MTSKGNSIQHDEAAELLGVYALDALDSDERAMVDEHLAQCPRCAAEVARHYEVAGLLANTGAEAPPQIWDRIAEQLGSPEAPGWEKLAPQFSRPEGLDDFGVDEALVPLGQDNSREAGLDILPFDETKRKNRFFVRGVSLVASAAAVLAIFLGLQVNHLNSQVTKLQALANKPIYTQALQAALEQPTTKRIPLTASGQGGTGTPAVTVALTTSGQDYVVAQKLAGLPNNMTYQLWGEINGRMVSLGLLGSKPSVIPFVVSPSAKVQLFAITVEPAGGVIQPTSQPMVKGVVTL